MSNGPLYYKPKSYQFMLQKSYYYLWVNVGIFLAILVLCLYLLNNITFIKQIFVGLIIAIMLFCIQKYFIFSSRDNPSVKTLIIDNDGYCIFSNHKEKQENKLKISNQHKLLKHSRVSFFGCWLCFKYKPTLFIFKDSLSEANFSQLSRIIKQL